MEEKILYVVDSNNDESTFCNILNLLLFNDEFIYVDSNSLDFTSLTLIRNKIEISNINKIYFIDVIPPLSFLNECISRISDFKSIIISRENLENNYISVNNFNNFYHINNNSKNTLFSFVFNYLISNDYRYTSILIDFSQNENKILVNNFMKLKIFTSFLTIYFVDENKRNEFNPIYSWYLYHKLLQYNNLYKTKFELDLIFGMIEYNNFDNNVTHISKKYKDLDLLKLNLMHNKFEFVTTDISIFSFNLFENDIKLIDNYFQSEYLNDLIVPNINNLFICYFEIINNQKILYFRPYIKTISTINLKNDIEKINYFGSDYFDIISNHILNTYNIQITYSDINYFGMIKIIT